MTQTLRNNTGSRLGDPWLPLTWRLGMDNWWEAVLVVCENGHIANLTTGGWSISAAGEVTPSIHCVTPMGDAGKVCGWHVFVVLEGWGDR